MIVMRLLSLTAFALAACAATATRLNPEVEVLVSSPFILPESKSQALFDDAIRWSREHQLETGGCFTIYQIIGRTVVIIDATERVIWRRPHRVQLDCPETGGQWHTHWQEEDSTYVGCNVQKAADRATISQKAALGLIICGVGKDSVLPYNYSATADSTREAYLEQNPDVRERLIQANMAANQFTCADEAEVSLRRPRIRCRN